MRQVTVVNAQGLHMRPANAIATLAGQFHADIELIRDGVRVNAKSIMAVLTLAAERGTQLTIKATGEDAGAALDALSGLIATGFGENWAPPAPTESTASGQPQC